jgi:hypothetical protein
MDHGVNDMMLEISTLECPCCKKRFYSEYEHGGSIEHENSYENTEWFVSSFDNGRDKEKLFLWAINLDDNFCDIKDREYSVGMDIFNCVLKRMKICGRYDIYIWLESKEHEVKNKYNDIRIKVIEKLKKKIEKEKSKLIT